MTATPVSTTEFFPGVYRFGSPSLGGYVLMDRCSGGSQIIGPKAVVDKVMAELSTIPISEKFTAQYTDGREDDLTDQMKEWLGPDFKTGLSS